MAAAAGCHQIQKGVGAAKLEELLSSLTADPKWLICVP